MNSGGMLLTLSKNMSDSMMTTLLLGTVNGGLIYMRIGRKLVHGNRSRTMVRIFGGRLGTGLVCISTASQFLDGLRGMTSPRRGHGVVNNRFVHIFRRRTHGLGKVSFLKRNAVCPSVMRDNAGATGVIGSRRGMNNLPRSLRFRLMRPLHRLFGSRIHTYKIRLNLPCSVICHRPFPNPNLKIHYLKTVAHSHLRTIHRSSTVLHRRFRLTNLSGGM